MQASSQKEKNQILEHYLNEAINPNDELINFGIYPDSKIQLSYVQVSIAVALLINSRSLDFIVTGCSSGQGMMLACNTFPNVQCGYLPTPQDAFLFSHINNGNVASFPLGLNWGWSGEINLAETMKSLFKLPWGTGYPPSQASRKMKNTTEVKELNQLNKKSIISILPSVDPDLLIPILKYKPVYDFIIQNGTNHELVDLIKKLRYDYFN
ncbi:RpiB/LacA/LacB family sugar-phosphate isomerase [Lactobacillus gasseri]|uniref:4-deoxy-L-threo-5-hexosulose-uronate ketol-isomerase n=6 Tax=Lactobacillus TaxID=1578 RepID=A0A833FLR7_LACGS|nr:RpiB/LacA/LacB family sugar-phosphate isomerase [Lactobacillus gasseri]KAB1921225.1 4-deoxy-L-threo-5-hexosulose-uronate ketol-isomerase [Lactobacillus gasseri ATCC 33323 = JCM 1131]KAB1951382.1 4-deoxy-L-threo-5-hexosulose-uronate ketol-isomerase [Lactobacillus gasseri]MBO1899157.1 RpiB/LacA/LacB family sugar-phosphate isomerase [Lactobacillus gasseri]MBS5341560.1 RpiB/LacA/LacB family sugar-phosphate isomerase [Lactobacillus gasseri]MBV6739452.1 RpiB/LacA/LacB family sugar-phosphate isome